jgi:hypothetical protein
LHLHEVAPPQVCGFIPEEALMAQGLTSRFARVGSWRGWIRKASLTSYPIEILTIDLAALVVT